MCGLLTSLVLVGGAPYISELGFYSDDWAFMGLFSNASDQSVLGLFRVIFSETAARPVQSLYLAGLFRLFGADPTAYHLVNHVVFLSAVIFFYLCLQKLGLPRAVAVAWPLVFATLPHYSTDRLWIAAFHATLSVALYCVSLYAGLQAVSSGRRWLTWRIVSVIGMVASVLAYEVVAPFFLLNPLLEGTQRLRHADRAFTLRNVGRVVAPSLLVVLAVLALAVSYKTAHSVRDVIDGDYGTYLLWLASESVTTNYIRLGMQLPQKVAVVLSHYATRASLPGGVILGVLAFVACHVATRRSPISATNRSTWLRFAACGFVLSLGGYGAFLMSSHIGFAETGVNNRTAIGAAAGVALAFVGLTGLTSSFLPSERLRRACFCLGVALFCVAGHLINTTVASFWVEASGQQRSVIQSLRSEFPRLPPRTTVLLDGICRYIGPGIVFETSWDVTGMLQVYHRDPTLGGDVVTSRTVADENGVVTMIYGDTTRYPYSDTLFVYDVARKVHQQLSDVGRAQHYFSHPHSLAPATCVEGLEGFGAPIF